MVLATGTDGTAEGRWRAGRDGREITTALPIIANSIAREAVLQNG